MNVYSFTRCVYVHCIIRDLSDILDDVSNIN